MTRRSWCCGAAAAAMVIALAGCGGARAGAADVAAPAQAQVTHEPDTLRFELTQGNVRNYFFRRGKVSAHLVVTSGTHPRIVFAFPSGNAGVGLWFEGAASDVTLEAHQPVSAVERPNGMRGVTAVFSASAPSLRVHKVVMSSIRVLRDYVVKRTTPPEIKQKVEPGPPVVVRRTTLDGKHHFELRIEPIDGTAIAALPSGELVLSAAPGSSSFSVRMTALHDDPALTPIPLDHILTSRTLDNRRDFRALAFLSYRQKLLAGSWRFLTYFGRDTLMSVRLLMPALEPPVIEGGLGSVLARLNDKGEVAHEEDIGEFATLENIRAGRKPTRKPIYHYQMVDGSFMLAPVVAHYLLDTAAGKNRAAAFLAMKTDGGVSYRQALERNLAFVLASAAPFGKQPVAKNLIGVKPGQVVGDWRDSQDCGIGGGKYPFSVNVVLVPAALRAAARLYASPLLADAGKAAKARALAAAWTKARALFRVEVPAAAARARLTAYANKIGIDPAKSVATVTGPVDYWALSVGADGKPVPVMHSDDAFSLLLSDPPPEVLDRTAALIDTPFPAGLWTPIGIVVANPALSGSSKIQATFTRDKYHGTVVWSWQQAMMAAGLARQLRRTDLPAKTRQALEKAQSALWQVIRATDSMSTAELWSWTVKHGKFSLASWHDQNDESNAAQLWSTVYLAITPPAARARPAAAK